MGSGFLDEGGEGHFLIQEEGLLEESLEGVLGTLVGRKEEEEEEGLKREKRGGLERKCGCNSVNFAVETTAIFACCCFSSVTRVGKMKMLIR